MVKYCKTCLMPDTRPRIEFDDGGICNACHTAERKKEIDWDARRTGFDNLHEREATECATTPNRGRPRNIPLVVP